MASPSIEAFWSWWGAGGRGECDAAVASSSWDGVSETIDRLVGAIDPGLQWEFGHGRLSANVLCLSGAGNAELLSCFIDGQPLADDEADCRPVQGRFRASVVLVHIAP